MKLSKLKFIRKSDESIKTPVIPLILLFLVIISGTIGYYLLWKDIPGADMFDAFYMTIITITTIGFAEIHPMNYIGRLLTIFIAIGGIGSLFFILTVFMENLFIMQLNNVRGKKKMLRKIDNLNRHIILIGFGRVGQLAAKVLLESNEEFVVIDDDFIEHDLLETKEKILKVKGDATSDEILIKAGIERAKGVIVTTANPATTVFVVLSAKVFNPKIFIVARADDYSDIEKLKRAGADRVVNPYSIGGQHLANLMIQPNVIDFFELSFGAKEDKFTVENITLPENSIWLNKSLKELHIRQSARATILAVIRDDNPIPNPDGNFILENNDVLIVFGTRSHLKNLENLTLETK